jgi:hypothetical protein
MAADWNWKFTEKSTNMNHLRYKIIRNFFLKRGILEHAEKMYIKLWKFLEERKAEQFFMEVLRKIEFRGIFPSAEWKNT